MEKMTVAQEAMISSSTKDEILPLYRLGQKVRLKKDIRNDGTYPFAKNGEILVKKGADGYVRKIGDFLMVIRVYEIDFIKEGMVYGCREEELEAADEGHSDVDEELEWMRAHRAKKGLSES